MAAPFTPADWERARALLCGLGDAIRDAVLAARNTYEGDYLAGIAAVTSADTIYAIDKVSEGTVLGWMRVSWPPEWPVEIVMEGAGEDGEPLTFPRHTPLAQTILKTHHRPHRRHARVDVRQTLRLGARRPRSATWSGHGSAPHHGGGDD